MRRATLALFVLLSLIPMIRVASTLRVFSQTIDEPAHISAGMEWLVRGTYNRDPEHPPLARVMFGLLPYLDGARDIDPNAILERNDRYQHNLAQARAGNLLFLAISLVVVAVWSARLFGAGTALLALALFGALPPILAHAGLATTDTAAMATTALALFLFSEWLGRPSWTNAILLGVAIALGCLTKFSFILFFPAGAIALAATRRTLPRVPRLMATIPLAALIVWGGYRFSTGTIKDAYSQVIGNEQAQAAATRYAAAPGYQWVTADHVLRYQTYAGKAALRDVTGIDFVDWARAAGYPSPKAGRSGRDTMLGAPPVDRDPDFFIPDRVRAILQRFSATVPVPAPMFFVGLDWVRRHSDRGHAAFLLGRYRYGGWWYYFPVVWFFKTPVPFVILSLAGIALMMWKGSASARGVALAPLAMLVPAMTAGINIGLRHILPLYPLLAICAAYAVATWWKYTRLRPVVVMLLGWYFVATAMAHPDYLAYFNELAGAHPEEIATDSNLDWGQDIQRLSDFVRREKIEHLHVAVFGNWERYSMPAEPLARGVPVTGWVAVSEVELKLGGRNDRGEGYEWLKAYQPVRKIGKSIRVYYITR
jgi:4-amino-4-deoxy-L-arabinose transferase-like glycosyltransferase